MIVYVDNSVDNIDNEDSIEVLEKMLKRQIDIKHIPFKKRGKREKKKKRSL